MNLLLEWLDRKIMKFLLEGVKKNEFFWLAGLKNNQPFDWQNKNNN
jgi:hypothetical protein